MCLSFTVMNRTCALYSYIILRTSSLENNAFSVMHYVEKVTLYYLMLHRFEFHSVFLPWNFRARLYYAAASQPRVFVRLLVGNHRDRPQHASWDGDCIYVSTSINFSVRNGFTCRLFFEVKRSLELTYHLPA